MIKRSNFRGSNFLSILRFCRRQDGNGQIFMRTERKNLVMMKLRKMTMALTNTVIIGVKRRDIMVTIRIRLNGLILRTREFTRFKGGAVNNSIIMNTRLCTVTIATFRHRLIVDILRVHLFMREDKRKDISKDANDFNRLRVFTRNRDGKLSLDFNTLRNGI